MPTITSLPPLPTWSELKAVKYLSKETRRSPRMPADPMFLDKSIRGYFMRYLIVKPTLDLSLLAIGFVSQESTRFSIQYSLINAIISIITNAFGYFALKNVIPEWLAVLGYGTILQCTGEMCVTVFEITRVLLGIRDAAAASKDDDYWVFVSVSIVVVLFVIANGLFFYIVVFKVIFPLRLYGLECHRRLEVDLSQLSMESKENVNSKTDILITLGEEE
ncbi:hypothetical protein BDR26DRAFT_854928 [Obelidium mucronatum]|nr:hypothetical protein BDR26DRAFT_854928 [Obelidium mucronatum]